MSLIETAYQSPYKSSIWRLKILFTDWLKNGLLDDYKIVLTPVTYENLSQFAFKNSLFGI